MRELAGQYPRYGYRKILVFRARRGHPMSAQRTYRLWHQAGLHVPRRRPRRRVASGVGALIQRGGRAVAGMLTIATAGGS